MFSRSVKSLSTTATARLSQLSHQLNPLQQVRTASQFTKFKLNTGAEIPAIGFGTWQDVDAQEQAVLAALKAGYRHIDTARVYGTERAVGAAIKKSGVPREEVFVTTKLWNNAHHPDDVEPALDASLKDLGLDYVDLYLMHWPSPFMRGDKLMPKGENGKIRTGDVHFVDTYRAMEKLLQTGKTKAIGISNFSRAEMEKLLAETSVVPAVHQIEVHPYLQQAKFASFHAQRGIHISQYSPFGNQNQIYSKGQSTSKLIEDPVLREIGRKYGKTGAQTALAWGLAHARSVLPKSKTESRIAANLDADFALDRADVAAIDALDRKQRFNNPSEAFGWSFYADLDGV